MLLPLTKDCRDELSHNIFQQLLWTRLAVAGMEWREMRTMPRFDIFQEKRFKGDIFFHAYIFQF
jgi:hypothetical protein